MMRCVPIVIFLLFLIPLKAQHTVDFNSPLQVCQGEFLKLVNTSETAVETKWSFCSDQLDRTYSSSSVGSVVGNMTDLAIVEDNGQWYGFATSRNNLLIRLNFGNNPNNSFTTTIITDTNNLLVGPEGISIIKEGNNWFGLITLISSEIIRIYWGPSLASMPQMQSLNLNSTGKLSNPIQIEIEIDQGNYVAVIANTTGSFITTINFGSSLSNAVTASNMLVSPTFPSAVNLYGVTVSKHCGQWALYALAQNHIYKVEVGSSLFSSISTGQISDFTSSVPISIGDFNKIHSMDIGKYTYVYFISYTGQYLAAVKWLEASSSPQFLFLGNPTVPPNPYSFDIFNYNGKYGLYVAGFGGTMNLLTTDGICHSSAIFSSKTSPIGVSYNQPGSYTINLEETYVDGQTCSQTKQITVTSGVAPLPLITNDNICISSTVLFNAVSQNEVPISGWNWNFDSTASTAENPTHIFNLAGEYAINLEVTSTNGCLNTISKSLKIYDKPIPLFSLPSGLICTSNEFTFENTTVDNFDGNLSYQWLVDNVLQSTSRDLKYAFAAGGNKEVKLITSIPGCADEHVQLINNVLTGPTVGFNIDGKCEGVTVNFTNTSSGDITGYVWDSGNGQTSMATNFTNNYPTKGTYNVSLKTTANNGCVSTMVKPLTIYSQPQPNFSLDLPPFSCSGTPSQFNDLTPNPTDSNLASWAWNFGDAGTSTERNPLHTFTTAGNYNVSLTATTNFGCSGSFQKSVTIAPSPPVDFTFTPACINQGTRFTDASGSGVKSWLWTIGGSTYAFSNPTHVFGSTGNYTAKLTVTGNNSCVATVTKTIHVPVAPSLSFSVDNACEKQAANFKDTTPVTTDPAVSWAWDFAGQATASGSAVPYSFAKAGSYAVKMTSTQQSGCVYSLSKNVTINTSPVAAFTSSPEWGVPPLSVQFTNTSTGANSYLWHFNDKTNSTSTQASPTFQFTDLGDYVVDLMATSASGCSSTASGKISVVIPSLDLELKQLQLVKDPVSNGYRIFVTVKNKSNYLLTSVDVVVDISGNALIKETINTSLAPDAEVVQLLNNQILPHGNLLTYLCASVEVVNDNDPFNNSKCEPIEEETVVFNPFPNPSNGSFRFQWISPATDMAHFEIFNSMGQLAFEQYAESVQVGLNQVQFDLPHLNTGAYYFRFSSGSISKTLPVQIVR